MHRIKQHRNWLLNPPIKQPERSDFGLPNDKTLVAKDQLNAFVEIQSTYNQNVVEDFNLDINTLNILQREKAFLNANQYWNQYQNWKTTRNPDRAVLESKFGFDTKHGMHLYRLITEGRELLLTGNITFPRPDYELLKDIRNGLYSYENLLNMIGGIDESFDEMYRNSTLPNKPQIEKVDELCIRTVEESI